jgi:hypothetical protein
MVACTETAKSVTNMGIFLDLHSSELFRTALAFAETFCFKRPKTFFTRAFSRSLQRRAPK